MVSTFAVKCGISTYSTYLSMELNQFTNLFVTGLSEFPYPNEKALDEFKPNFPFYNCWRRNESFDKLIQDSQNYDLIHCQHQFGLFPNEYNFVKLLRQVKKPLVTTLHDVIPPNPQLANYMNEIIINSNKIIVHTEPCLQILNSYNLSKGKVELIPHGTKLIDVPSKADARAELNIPLDKKIILSWGFIWESKGLLDLVKILAEIKKTMPEAMLIHAGGVHPIIEGSSYLRKVVKEALNSKLSPRDLVITQWVPEEKVPLYFGACDLIVLNYMRGSASASGAAHRAMAAHRPVVKTDDLCISEIPGYTVPRFDINALYKALLTVLNDEVLQAELVAKADKASQEMSWSNVALAHKKVYLKL